jgi:penicillin-binding protein 1C
MSRALRSLRVAGLAALGALLAASLLLALAVAVFPYPLPRLSEGAASPIVIVDRSGTVLRSVPPQGGGPGREAWVPLDRISSHAVLALVASEDQNFFLHRGVDPVGILRALWLDARAGALRVGGSTLTMQLVKLVHHGGEPRSLGRKIEEVVLALRLERTLERALPGTGELGAPAGKRFILEQYLNRAYYGNGAVGIEAAARRYFGKPAASLSVGEATLLSVIPRGPQRYEPIRHLGAALARRDQILRLLVEQGLLAPEEARRARAQTLRPRLAAEPFRAAHFVDFVLARLPESVRRQGGRVRTSLDLALQERLEARLADHVDGLRHLRVDQGGLVVLDTRTGEILAMVGSPGFARAGGQVNIATWRRHPGSALKPFVYGLAIEEGDSPATVAYDVADVPSSAYRIRGREEVERGPVRYREALAGSYNLAAVHVLEKVGVEKLATKLRLAGASELPGSPADYGLRLALGSTRVRLVDLASAYGAFARGGLVTPPRPVLDLEFAPERRIFSPEAAWLVLDVLADPEARRPRFGEELPVDLPYPVAAKTGTARGFSDTVALLVTRELTAAAWVGNFDGRPSYGVRAMAGAAPLAREALLLASGGRRLTLPPRPPRITALEVCPLSGKRPGPDCPDRKHELFIAGHEPHETCAWHRTVNGRPVVEWPTEVAAWAERQRTKGGRDLGLNL